jgi:hypothetical protein
MGNATAVANTPQLETNPRLTAALLVWQRQNTFIYQLGRQGGRSWLFHPLLDPGNDDDPAGQSQA